MKQIINGDDQLGSRELSEGRIAELVENKLGLVRNCELQIKLYEEKRRKLLQEVTDLVKVLPVEFRTSVIDEFVRVKVEFLEHLIYQQEVHYEGVLNPETKKREELHIKELKKELKALKSGGVE